MKNILWIGDAPDSPSGFGLATKKIVESLDHRCGNDGQYRVTVLGINHKGDPPTTPYSVYSAVAGGDPYGIGRLLWMCDLVKPDVIVLQNDPWNVPAYLQTLKRPSPNYSGEYADVPVIGHLAVDGKNCRGRLLKDLAHAIFWTEFAQREAKLGGYEGPSSVIPLGVDLNTYYPIEQLEARMRRLPKQLDDAFIVGNVNRNQPRKRWDLTVRYFAEWVYGGMPVEDRVMSDPDKRIKSNRKIDDAFLYLHTAPTGDVGADVKQLAIYYGVAERMALYEPPTFYGISEDEMRDTYNCFDAQITTTQGEGFGLTTFEGMACGVPQIAPEWSALGELLAGSARLTKCTSTAIGPPYVNVVGGVADEAEFIDSLDKMYRLKEFRTLYRDLGLRRASELRFRWENVGQAWVALLDEMLSRKKAEKREAVTA